MGKAYEIFEDVIGYFALAICITLVVYMISSLVIRIYDINTSRNKMSYIPYFICIMWTLALFSHDLFLLY